MTKHFRAMNPHASEQYIRSSFEAVEFGITNCLSPGAISAYQQFIAQLDERCRGLRNALDKTEGIKAYYIRRYRKVLAKTRKNRSK